MNQQTLFPSPSNAIATASDGYLIYNLETHKLHRLNTTAALILELCAAGNKTSGQICNDLAAVFEGNANTCLEWINQAQEEGLLNALAANESSPPDRKAGEFSSRANELRGEGEVLAAFVCQQYATELQPENADNWLVLGELGHIVGRRETAKDAYQEYLKLHPGNAEAAHILEALLDKDPPARAPDECIQQLYSRFSEFYEKNMCGELGYEAPARLKDMMDQYMRPAAGDLSILELGCGTGLAGKVLRPRAKTLIGIDLSPDMIEQSKVAKLYDALHVAEITSYLAKDSSTYDLIAACDTFIYFGDLDQVISPAADSLFPGGHLVFTVEKGEGAPFKLTDSGRYAHTEEHIRSVAKSANLKVLAIDKGFLRQEFGEPVAGLITLLGKPA